MKMLCLTCGLLLPLAALAQADTLPVQLAQCAAIADIKARVACYDALARPTQDKSRAETPAPASTESFGHPKPRIERDEAHEATLVAKVTAAREVQPNRLEITLANGQVWQQAVGKAFLVRTGDTVRIAGSGWGRSFRLSVEGHPGFIQVSRLR